MNTSTQGYPNWPKYPFPSPCGEKIVMNDTAVTRTIVSSEVVSVPLRGKDSHERGER